MKFNLDTHLGITFINPTIELVQTIDKPDQEVFIPSVLVIQEPSIRVHHELPPQPYVNGSWGDADVQNAIGNYFNSIDQDGTN